MNYSNMNLWCVKTELQLSLPVNLLLQLTELITQLITIHKPAALLLGVERTNESPYLQKMS